MPRWKKLSKVKEQDIVMKRDLSEMVVSNMLDGELKATFIRHSLGWVKNSENLTRELEQLKRIKQRRTVQWTRLRDTWVGHWIKHPTLDFGLGYDVMVWEIEPQLVLCSDCLWSLIGIFSPSLSASLLLSLSVSLSENKQVFFSLLKKRLETGLAVNSRLEVPEKWLCHLEEEKNEEK